ncbi:substrate-binding domain-containing protein [Cryptosporangium sp. NPDC051539]|uniref:vWA domain-containing protein n=1 Tax=Cryptosporangium sp. NPDC051539 TaxID=3363962 RepID=UPI0037B37ACC
MTNAGSGRRRLRPHRRYLVAFVLATFAIGGPAAATDLPDSGLAWTALALFSMLGALTMTEAMVWALRRLGDVLRDLLPPGPVRTWLRDLWSGLPRPVRAIGLPAVVVVLGLIVGLILVPSGQQKIYYWIIGCQPPPTLRVLTTPESLATTSALATEYEEQSAARHQGCASADVYPYAADPAAARDALANGWSTDSLEEIGPRPDAWMPDSTVDVTRVAEAGKSERGSLIESVEAIATTPLVLGIPARLAPEGDERWTRRTWAELLDAADDAGLSVVRPQPATSTTGEVATELIYRSLSDGAKAYDADAARALERRIGGALDRGRYTLGNADAILCRHRAADVPAATPAVAASRSGTPAVILTEQQLVRYNLGRPLGENCPSDDPVPADRQLVAAYPADTAALDHPLVRLRWSHVTARQSDAARDWAEWLRSEAGRRALITVGLRPPVGDTSLAEPLTVRWGVHPDAVFAHAGPPSADVDQALDAYAIASRPARTLVLLDSSGSMKTKVDAGTRFDAARTGITAAFDTIGQSDEVGLWTFPAQPRQLLDLRVRPPGEAGRLADRALKAVHPDHGTPLYRSIEAGLDALGRADEDQVTTLIVVTDGEDTDEGRPPTPRALAARASTAKVRISVVALGDADCAGLPLSTLTDGSGGECESADSRTLGGVLIDLFEAR